MRLPQFCGICCCEIDTPFTSPGRRRYLWIDVDRFKLLQELRLPMKPFQVFRSWSCCGIPLQVSSGFVLESSRVAMAVRETLHGVVALYIQIFDALRIPGANLVVLAKSHLVLAKSHLQ